MIDETSDVVGKNTMPKQDALDRLEDVTIQIENASCNLIELSTAEDNPCCQAVLFVADALNKLAGDLRAAHRILMNE